MWNADLGLERLSKSPMRPPRINANWTKARSFATSLSYRVAIRRLCLILLKKRSTRLRGFVEVGTEAIGLLRLLFGGMPCSLVDDEFSDPVGVLAMIGKQHRSTLGETDVCRQADCREPAGRQREPDRQAIGIKHRMNLARQPAPWLSSVPSDACTVLMHADNRGVDHLDGCVMGSGKCVYDTTPHTGPPPANEAVLARCLGIERIRQIAPWWLQIAGPRKCH